MKNQQGTSVPTQAQINEYRKNLKSNTELIELEARNFKGQYEALYYKIQIANLQASQNQLAMVNQPNVADSINEVAENEMDQKPEVE